jgi:transposase
MRSVNVYYDPEQPVTPPDGKSYYCPVCGHENPRTYYIGFWRRVVGCENCIEVVNAAEWEYDHA